MRFFECTNCRKRTKCTKGIPQTGCEGCGKHDAWKRCGARPGRGPAEGPRDKQFVAAVSEVSITNNPKSTCSQGIRNTSDYNCRGRHFFFSMFAFAVNKWLVYPDPAIAKRDVLVSLTNFSEIVRYS